MEQGQIAWFEIPVGDLDRAINFYTSILRIKVKRIKLLDQEQGFFDNGKGSINGVLVERENYKASPGCKLFFYVIDISEILHNISEGNGKLIVNKTLLKQKTTSGSVVIANNLIDQNVGYYAEIEDSEGNRIGLYSNS
ncbi:MAG: VOC family protein [Bacteroidota bacterium]|nr:VOC family protein [Bacteroidota bacterium]